MRLLRLLGWTAYQAGLVLLLLTAAPFLLLRRGGLGHYLRTLRGRLTLDLPPAPAGDAPRLWIHAVSVGEVSVGVTLLRALPATVPVVMTTVTPTGQELAKKSLRVEIEAGRAQVAYLPFDLAPLLRRFHHRFGPAALVLVEGDYWPLALAVARRRGLPVAVVNARASDRAFRRQRPLGRVNRLFYAPIDRFCVQTAADADRLTGLGAASERVAITGNLKFDALPPAEKPELEAALTALAAGRPILVAGSTMAGEDQAVLDAFDRLAGERSALLVLAPRHPERWEAVAELLSARGVRFMRRSSLPTKPVLAKPVPAKPAPVEPVPAADVVLLDSLGELARVYALGRAAFIGGTLVGTGGHNPIEPAHFAVATAVGPSMHNFREMAEIFDRAAAWARVADAGELAAVWSTWLARPEEAAAVGARARRLLDDHRGATRRSVEAIWPLLAAAGVVEASS